jgi:hypothetical protein
VVVDTGGGVESGGACGGVWTAGGVGGGGAVEGAGRRRISVLEGAGVGKRRRRSYTAEEGNHA